MDLLIRSPLTSEGVTAIRKAHKKYENLNIWSESMFLFNYVRFQGLLLSEQTDVKRCDVSVMESEVQKR